jgi:hypothetical protein
MTTNEFTVRFTTVNRKDELVTKEKSFKTKAGLQKWLDRDDNGVVDVRAFSDPMPEPKTTVDELLDLLVDAPVADRVAASKADADRRVARGTSHADCTHETSARARAACRKARKA